MTPPSVLNRCGRSPRRRSAAALAVAIVATCVDAPAAVASEPLPTTGTAPRYPITVPADLADYTSIANVIDSPAALLPDGRFAWFHSRQRADDDARDLGQVSLPQTVNQSTARVIADFSSVPRTTTLRDEPSGQVPAFGGRTWVLDHQRVPRPARDRLVGIGDDGSIVKRALPRGLRGQLVVPSSRGLRVVGTVTRRGRDPYVAVTSPSRRRLVRVRFLSGVTAAAATRNGDLLIAGPATSPRLPIAMVRVTPSGRVHRLNDRRALDASGRTSLAGMVPTRFGVLTDEASESGLLDKAAVVLRDSRGRVRIRRRLSELGVAAIGGPQCSAYKAQGVAAGPDGYPFVRITCSVTPSFKVGDPIGSPVGDELLVGLSRTLRATWVQQIAFPRGIPRADNCGPTLTGADNRLWAFICQSWKAPAAVAPISVPGAPAPSAGRLRSTRRGKRSGVVARVRCVGDYGKICRGEAVLTSKRGDELGRASYALPARPKREAGEILRVIPTQEKVPSGYRVRLVAG